MTRSPNLVNRNGKPCSENSLNWNNSKFHNVSSHHTSQTCNKTAFTVPQKLLVKAVEQFCISDILMWSVEPTYFNYSKVQIRFPKSNGDSKNGIILSIFCDKFRWNNQTRSQYAHWQLSLPDWQHSMHREQGQEIPNLCHQLYFCDIGPTRSNLIVICWNITKPCWQSIQRDDSWRTAKEWLLVTRTPFSSNLRKPRCKTLWYWRDIW